MDKIKIQNWIDEGLLRFNKAQTIEDYQHALKSISEVLNYADELSNKTRLHCMLLRAKCFDVLGQPSNAEQVLRKVIREVEPESIENQAFIVDTKLSLGNILCKTDKYEEGIMNFLASTSFFHQNNDWHTEAKIHLVVAETYQNHQHYQSAISELNIAWLILEPHVNTKLHLTVLFSLGHYYFLLGDQHSAIKWEERALFVAQSLGDVQTEKKLMKNLAGFTFNIEDFPRAIHYNEKKLQEARIVNNIEEIKQSLSYLGACYTETGQSKKGIKFFDEVLSLLSSHGQEQTPEAGMNMVMKAQACLDMKQYHQTRNILSKARNLIKESNPLFNILKKLEEQMLRETKSPLVIDCTHRILKIATAGSSQNTMHINPQPSINLTKFHYLTSNLTENERIHLSNIHKELQNDIFQIKYSNSKNQSIPDTFSMPLKFEYIDDVEGFELKWSAFKREVDYTEKCFKLQTQWDQIRNKITFSDGTFQGDKEELILYLQHLSQITELCAEIGNRQLLQEVALHSADFLEIETEDPMLAALVWPIRWRLLIAAHSVAKSECHELIEIEILRSINQFKEVFCLLDLKRQQFALQFVVGSWFHAANTILGKEGYNGLVEIVADHKDSLKPVDQIRYGIAIGEVISPTKGLLHVNKVLEKTRAANPNIPIILAPELEIALAIIRFKSMAPNLLTCEMQYGLFAPYIHEDVSSWTDEIFPSLEQKVAAPRPDVLAFTDENLVVLDIRLKGSSYVATLMHEIQHQILRVGQQLCTDNGEWLLVKRDIPIASALTYFSILQTYDNDLLDKAVNKIQKLVSMGKTFADEQPDDAKKHIKNMLQYFEDLGRQESRASYPCAAILLGMGYSYLKNPESVRSYLKHLEVMDHDEALIYGKRIAELRM